MSRDPLRALLLPRLRSSARSLLFFVAATLAYLLAGWLGLWTLAEFGSDLAAPYSLLLALLTWALLRADSGARVLLQLAFGARRADLLLAAPLLAGLLTYAVLLVCGPPAGGWLRTEPADAAQSLVAPGWALLLLLVLLLPEELLLRGLLRRRLGLGSVLVLVGLLSGLYRLIGSAGDGLPALGLLPALLGLVLAGIALAGRGQPLPAGLHFGCNWVQLALQPLPPHGPQGLAAEFWTQAPLIVTVALSGLLLFVAACSLGRPEGAAGRLYGA